MVYGAEDFIRKVVGEEWKEEMQQCKDEEGWMRKAEERLDEYYKERKMPGNPRYEQRKTKKETYEAKIKEEEKEREEAKRKREHDEQKEKEAGREVKRKREEGGNEGKEEEWRGRTNFLTMVTDNQSLAAVMCGHDVLRDKELYNKLARTVQRLEAAMCHGWKINVEGGDPWNWRPREQNKAPDSICNYVMDHRCDFISVDLDATKFQVRPNMYISSDGGCRTEEGISATGWVIRAVGNNSSGDIVVLNVARGGTFINRACSSFEVEAYAMYEAMYNFLQCFNIQIHN